MSSLENNFSAFKKEISSNIEELQKDFETLNDLPSENEPERKNYFLMGAIIGGISGNTLSGNVLLFSILGGIAGYIISAIENVQQKEKRDESYYSLQVFILKKHLKPIVIAAHEFDIDWLDAQNYIRKNIFDQSKKSMSFLNVSDRVFQHAYFDKNFDDD